MTGMHPRLKRDRKKRLNRRAQARYRRKHRSSHKQKWGHRFVMNKIYDKSNPVCLKCGGDR